MALIRKDGSVEYEGKVITIETGKSYQIMSDIWGSMDQALVWDETTQQPKWVHTAIYDQGPYYHFAVVEVDATDDVWTKYKNWKVRSLYQERERQIWKEEAVIRKGDYVKVENGRTAKGEIGLVFWSGETQWGIKYGLALTDVKVEQTYANGKKGFGYRDVVWVYGKNVTKLHTEKKVKERLAETHFEDAAAKHVLGLQTQPTKKSIEYEKLEVA